MEDETYGEDSLHRCGMCGSCGAAPYWAPESMRDLSPRARARVLTKLEIGRRAFVATRNVTEERNRVNKAARPGALRASNPSTFERGLSLSTVAPTPKAGLELVSPMPMSSPATRQPASPGASSDSSAMDLVSELHEAVVSDYDSDIDSDSFHTAPSDKQTPSPAEIIDLPEVTSGEGWTELEGATSQPIAPGIPQIDIANGADEPPWQANVAVVGDARSAPATPLGRGTPRLDKTSPFEELPEHRGIVDDAVSEDCECASSSVSLHSPPNMSVPLTDAIPNVQGIDHCDRCEKSATRVRELETHVQALECALRARAAASDSMRSRGMVLGETSRLRDEVDSLRLTVDFLFQKLQKYEVSPRDRPEAH